MGRKTSIILLVVLIVIGVLAIGAVVIFMFARRNVLDGPGMINEASIKSLTLSEGGSMTGGYSRITLDGAKFTVEEQEYHDSPVKKETYDADASLYTDIEDIVRKYNLRKWNNLPESDIMILDGGTTSVYIEYSDGGITSFDSDDEYPEVDGYPVAELYEVFEKRQK